MHIYAWRLWQVAAVTLAAVLLCAGAAWALLGSRRGNVRRRSRERRRRALSVAGVLAAALSLAALAGILRYTVWGRVPSAVHEFAWVSPYAYELVREMVMNAFLYVPLGLFFPYAVGFLADFILCSSRRRKGGSKTLETKRIRPWVPYLIAVLVAFALSLSVEAWQYLAGTGLSQGTDVLCNTLGAAIGGISYLLFRRLD